MLTPKYAIRRMISPRVARGFFPWLVRKRVCRQVPFEANHPILSERAMLGEIEGPRPFSAPMLSATKAVRVK